MPATGVRRAGADVGRRARDCAGGRDAAEKRRDDIGNALRHELLVGIVAVVDLRVGHARGKQRLDGAEKGDRDGRGEQLAQRRQRDVGPGERGERLRNAAEARADGFHVELEQADHERGDDQHHDRAGQPGQKVAAAARGVGERAVGNRQVAFAASGRVRGSSASSASPDVVIAFGQSQSTARHAEATASVTGSTLSMLAAIVRMRVKNSSGIVMSSPRNSFTCESRMSTAMPLVKPITIDTGMKRMSPPMRSEAHREQQHAGGDRAHDEVGDAVLHDDRVDDHDVGAGRPADLHARPAEQRDQEAGDDRGEDAGLRRDARGDRERHGERERDDADRDAGDEIGAEVVAGVPGPEAVDELRPEAEDGEAVAHAHRIRVKRAHAS